MIGITNNIYKKDEIERVNLTLLTNQSTHDNLIGLNFTLTYGNYTKSFTWQGQAVTLEVPAYVDYTLTFEEKTGYKSPSEVTYNAQPGNSRTLNAIYQTCVLSVAITDNQSSLDDIASAKATIKGTTVNTSLSNGESIKVPYGEKVTITGSALTGYATPSVVTYTAADAAKQVTLTYNTTLVTVAMADNQTAYNDIANATATVAASGITTQTVSNGGVVKVPTGVSCTITWKAVTNYKTPAAQTFTTSGSSVTKTGTYQTEVVTISLSADNGVSVIGQKVTINGTTHTWNGTAITQKIAFGTSYSISVDAKSGYTTPSAQSFTASQSERNCNIVYKEEPLGVFIQGISGKLYSTSEWDSQETPNGIAVLTNNSRFVMSLDSNHNITTAVYGGYGVDSGAAMAETSEDAKLDFNGLYNTEQILSTIGTDKNSAAKWCRDYIFPNGKQGYLGSAGEWNDMFLNANEVWVALGLVGTVNNMATYYITSTQKSSTECWLKSPRTSGYVLKSKGAQGQSYWPFTTL